MTAEPAPPRNFDGFKAMLLSSRDTLSPRLIQLATFALEYPDEIALGTAASIASQASVQPSTLIRLAKRLGYSGFSDLQSVFRSVVRSNWPAPRERPTRVRASAAAGALLTGFAESGMESLERLLARESGADIAQAAKILARSNVIYLVGMRRASPVAVYLAYALATLGVRAVLVNNVAGLGPEQLTGANKRDALVAVSFTPHTPITVELVDRLATQGVPVIALTDGSFSPLAPKAAVTFEIPEADYAGLRSLAAIFCVALAIAVATGAIRNKIGISIPS